MLSPSSWRPEHKSLTSRFVVFRHLQLEIVAAGASGTCIRGGDVEESSVARSCKRLMCASGELPRVEKLLMSGDTSDWDFVKRVHDAVREGLDQEPANSSCQDTESCASSALPTKSRFHLSGAGRVLRQLRGILRWH